MTHPLVEQLQFTRMEWRRGLQGISEEDGQHHFGPMNCISWTVGHIAWHEQKYWLELALDRVPYPELNTTHAYRAPMSSPSLSAMLKVWESVVHASNDFLESVSTDALQEKFQRKGRPINLQIGSALRRLTYHYWYHIGEIQAVRQMLGHKNLPEYVGDIDSQAPYRPE